MIHGVKTRKNMGDQSWSFILAMKCGTFDAKYDIVFTNPETFISCKEGMHLSQSKPYQSTISSSCY